MNEKKIAVKTRSVRMQSIGEDIRKDVIATIGLELGADNNETIESKREVEISYREVKIEESELRAWEKANFK